MCLHNASPGRGSTGHPPLPVVTNHGGPVLQAPEVWTVFWPGDQALADQANAFFGWMLAIFIGGASGVLAWLFNQPAQSFTVDGKNILFIVFLWTIGHLQHSQFWIPFRGVWGNLILSPAHHQIHHSRDPAHYNRNLGSVLAIWDRAFTNFWRSGWGKASSRARSARSAALRAPRRFLNGKQPDVTL